MKLIQTSEGKITEFRFWLSNKWYEHCLEVLNWEGKQVDYTMAEWALKNKWFLKHKFKNRKKV
jgi:hypothetical protein